MPTPDPLRTMISAVHAALGEYLTATAPVPDPEPDPEPEPEPEPTPVEPPPPAPRARPQEVESYGPNGSHWPRVAPWLTDSVETIDVECSWAAIKAALLAVTPERAAAGVHIRVAPGTLPGNGAASGSAPVLQNLNVRGTNGEQVLVSARDGLGSVIIGDIHLRGVVGVTFALFQGGAVTRSGCSDTTLAWSLVKGWRVLGLGDRLTERCDLFEVVVSDEVRVGVSDPAGFGSGYPGSSDVRAGESHLRDCIAVGCYVPSRYLPAGATEHLDGVQLYGSGPYYNFVFIDCAIFGSNNCALQIGGWGASYDEFIPVARFLLLNHTLLVGPETSRLLRYPRPEGARVTSLNQATNGAGRAGQLYAENGTIILGTVYDSTWGGVNDTLVNYVSTKAKVLSGTGWTLDDALVNITPEALEALAPTPTPASLAAAWSV